MRVSIIVVLSALTLAACGGGGGGTDSTGTTGTTGNGGGSGTAPQTLNVSPSTAHLDPGQIQSFSATGGQPPYTFSVTAGAGTVDASGHYTASGGAGSATVRVMDTAGATAQATISVNAPFVTPSLAASLDSGTQHTFTAMGGQAPYTFSVRSGGGTIDSATGIYTTPATAGSATVQIVDALGSTQLITVTIAPQLSVLPGSITVTAASGQSFVFAGQGGTPPYTYALASGPGSVAADGTYTAGSSSGASTVTVTDQLGTSVSAQVRSLRIRVNGPVWATVIWAAPLPQPIPTRRRVWPFWMRRAVRRSSDAICNRAFSTVA